MAASRLDNTRGANQGTAQATAGQFAPPQFAPPHRGRLRNGAIALVLALAAVAALLAASDPRRLTAFAARRELDRIGAQYLGSEGVVLQADWNDCGPAALANAMLAVGTVPPPLDSLERLAGTGPAGTRASGLIAAGEALGLSLALQRVEPGQVAAVPLPFIAWVNRSHFVTVTGRTAAGTVTVVDPSVGRYTVGERDFRAIWSGEAIVIAG